RGVAGRGGTGRSRPGAEPFRRLIGQPAPEFTLPTAAGRAVALRSARRGRRAVLLAFWAAHGLGFQGELPYLQELRDRLNGLELITILQLYPAVVPDAPAGAALPAPIALQADTDDVADTYHVQQYPTLFLLDAGGRVVWCAEGFHPSDLAALRRALVRLGLT